LPGTPRCGAAIVVGSTSLLGAAAGNGARCTFSFGRGSVDQRRPVSWLRAYWIAIAPCGFGHRTSRIRTAFLDGPLRGLMFALVAKRQARTGSDCLLSLGAGDAVRVHRRSLKANRLRPEGLRTGYDSGSSVSRPLRGSADRSDRDRGRLPAALEASTRLSGALRSFWGWRGDGGRSRTSLLSSCVNRGRTFRGATPSDAAPSCPLGRDGPRPTCPPGRLGPMSASSSDGNDGSS
jgi:hypothetical protein